jgi:hypothetical protein
VRLCPWIFQAPGMSAAIGTKNKMRTRVERREKPSDLWIPYSYGLATPYVIGRCENTTPRLYSL